MINEKDLKCTQFFTTNGTDFWRNVQVRTVTQVMLKNIETSAKCICTVGADEPWVAVIMPETKAAKPAAKSVRGPYNKRAVITARKPSKSNNKKKTSNRKTSQYKGVERLKPNKSGQVKYKTSYWEGKTKKNIYLGTYDSELEAAAACQDHIGDKDEAARLRSLAKQQKADMTEQADNNPDRPGTGLKTWKCTHCKLTFRHPTKPMSCINCKGATFTLDK